MRETMYIGVPLDKLIERLQAFIDEGKALPDARVQLVIADEHWKYMECQAFVPVCINEQEVQILGFEEIK